MSICGVSCCNFSNNSVVYHETEQKKRNIIQRIFIDCEIGSDVVANIYSFIRSDNYISSGVRKYSSVERVLRISDEIRKKAIYISRWVTRGDVFKFPEIFHRDTQFRIAFGAYFPSDRHLSEEPEPCLSQVVDRLLYKKENTPRFPNAICLDLASFLSAGADGYWGEDVLYPIEDGIYSTDKIFAAVPCLVKLTVGYHSRDSRNIIDHLKMLKFIKELEWDNEIDKPINLTAILKECPNMKKINIAHSYLGEVDEAISLDQNRLEALTTSFQGLKNLHDLSSLCKNLKYLNIAISEKEKQHRLGRFDSLETLVYSPKTDAFNTASKEIIFSTPLKNLKSLTVVEWKNLQTLSLGVNTPSLKTLTIKNSISSLSSKNNTLKIIGLENTKASSLSLLEIRLDEDYFFNQLPSLAETLVEFNLQGSPQIKMDIKIEKILACKKLRKLTLDYVNIRKIQPICDQLQSLEILSLKNCYTIKGVCYLKAIKTLKDLSILSTDFDELSLVRTIFQMPFLETLGLDNRLIAKLLDLYRPKNSSGFLTPPALKELRIAATTQYDVAPSVSEVEKLFRIFPALMKIVYKTYSNYNYERSLYRNEFNINKSDVHLFSLVS